MKSLLTIQFPCPLEPVIKKGSLIKVGEVIARRRAKTHKEKIPLSQLLATSPSKITSFLTKNLGEKVKKGDVIASKEGIFKSIRVLSPFAGVLSEVDLKDGSLLLVSEGLTEIIEKSPIDGFVEGVTSEEITISFEGRVIEGEKGKGERVIGQSLVFEDHVDMHHFADEVASRIVIGKTFTEGARAKLNALGAKGLISEEFYDDFPLLVKVPPRDLKELQQLKNKNIILLGQLCRVIIPVA